MILNVLLVKILQKIVNNAPIHQEILVIIVYVNLDFSKKLLIMNNAHNVIINVNNVITNPVV